MGIEEIIQQVYSYSPEAETHLVRDAFALAADAHTGQFRVSGEQYISHPLGVATILAELQLDVESIAAGLLHDVVEDTTISIEDIEKKFGKNVALLVDGVTKLSRIEFKSKEEQQLESYRKMFMAMAKDIRVILIKLADRLHNMRTLKCMPDEKRKAISRETLEIFAPLAHRLGISRIKWELEDRAFRYMEPEKYHELTERVKRKRAEREEHINEAMDTIHMKLNEMDIRAEIQGRPKHFYSIYQKMVKQNKDLSEIFDLSAIRVIVDTVKDCYGTLGIVHSIWKPMPGRFKDYIAMPKSNMYQSLHTTVIGTSGEPLEIQIRTFEMHKTSEMGIAAHWRYKQGGSRGDSDYEQKLTWLRQLLEWQKDLRDTRDFMETVKMDVFSDEVFVFTPQGDVIDLPANSIPIDFAYRIHTNVGHSCVGAKVNGRMIPIDYKLKNGDIVEIITSKQSNGPSRDWLTIVHSSDTKNKIRAWFKRQGREDNIVKGREILERELKKLGYEYHELLRVERLQEIAKKSNYQTEDDLLAALGYGGVTLTPIVSKLVESYKKEINTKAPEDISKLVADFKPSISKQKDGNGILVRGESGVLVKLSRCCNPMPGDRILGYITRGKGVSIHRADCLNIINNDDERRLIDVSWNNITDSYYNVGIELSTADRPGVMSEIVSAVAETRTNMSSVNAVTYKNKLATIIIVVEVNSVAHLESVMNKLRRIRDVYTVNRMLPGRGGKE